MSGSSSLNITTLSSFAATCNVAVEMFLICHLISQDPEINWLCDFMGRNSYR